MAVLDDERVIKKNPVGVRSQKMVLFISSNFASVGLFKMEFLNATRA